MAKWLRVAHHGEILVGTLAHDEISIYLGDLFDEPKASGRTIRLSEARMLTPVVPSKVVALANNSRAMLEKQGNPHPRNPHYFLKSTTSLIADAEVIKRPGSYAGKVIFEGELGLVIGRECRNVSVAQAPQYLFGCTCVNDVTAIEMLFAESLFPQWTRAKAADTFGPIGPVIDTEVNPSNLTIRAVLDGAERQNYSTTDYVFTPAELISAISHDMTLLPGDVIACGTSLGVGSMKPGARIDISIEGIGTLSNTFE